VSQIHGIVKLEEVQMYEVQNAPTELPYIMDKTYFRYLENLNIVVDALSI
jgi:hypothetical protein